MRRVWKTVGGYLCIRWEDWVWRAYGGREVFCACMHMERGGFLSACMRVEAVFCLLACVCARRPSYSQYSYGCDGVRDSAREGKSMK